MPDQNDLEQYVPVHSKTSINEKLHYSGSGTSLALLMFKNLVLTILTLGIYWAWGRTNMRRYVWGNVIFLGDRASYTGTGKELFRGWVLVGVVYIVIAIIVNLLGKLNAMIGLLLLPGYIYLYALAIYSGTRYRLSRSSWRETAFGMSRNKETSKLFILMCFKGIFLSVLTLGIYSPIFQNNKRRFLTSKSRFGSVFFNYTGDNEEYFWLVIKNFLLTVVTLGIYTSWMIMNLLRYKLKHTTLNHELTFTTDLKSKDLFLFGICAYLGTIFTAGLAIPWVLNYTYKLFINSITVQGEIDFESINNLSSKGDSLAEALSIEYDLDLGF